MATIKANILKAVEAIKAQLDKNRDEFVATVKSFCKDDAKLKELQTKVKTSRPTQGKYIHVLRGEYLKNIEVGAISQSMRFPEYHQNAIGSKPNNHAESCAKCFSIAVELGHMSEQDYDDNSGEALSRAARVFTKANDVTGEHPASQAAIALLKRRPADILKQLKDLLENRIVPETDEDGNEHEVNRVLLTDEEVAERETQHSALTAIKTVDDVIQSGHLTALIGGMAALARTTEDENVIATLLTVGETIGQAIAENVDEEGNRRWTDEKLDELLGVTQQDDGIQIVTAETVDAPVEA